VSRSIAVLGTTGLVGGRTVHRLLADPLFDPVIAAVRRPVEDERWGAGRTPRQWLVDYEDLEDSADALDVHTVVCALGTTMRDAGSREAFRTVDLEYPLRAARSARERGAHHFILVSAIGADPRSRVFYNSVKGSAEEGVRALGYPSVTILRPSLLVGQRRDVRPAELIGRWIGLLVPGRWRPVQASDVAAAIVAAAREPASGVTVLESDRIRSIARAERGRAEARAAG